MSNPFITIECNQTFVIPAQLNRVYGMTCAEIAMKLGIHR